jgi:hypothetical protein
MTLPEFKDAEAIAGLPGFSGDLTGNATLADHETRIDTLEAAGSVAAINDLSDVDTATDAPTSGDLLQWDGTNWVPYALPATTATANLGYLIDGGGAPITTGVKYGFKVDFAGTVTLGTAAADVSTTAAIGVWIDTYANFPPTLTDEKFVINLTAQNKNKTAALSVAFAADSFFYFNVGANNNATVLMVSLKITRTL